MSRFSPPDKPLTKPRWEMWVRKTPDPNQADSQAQEHNLSRKPYLYKRWEFRDTKVPRRQNKQREDRQSPAMVSSGCISHFTGSLFLSGFPSAAWPNLCYEEQFIFLPLSCSHQGDRWRGCISKGSSDAHHGSEGTTRSQLGISHFYQHTQSCSLIFQRHSMVGMQSFKQF